MKPKTVRYPLYFRFQLLALALILLTGMTSVAQGNAAIANTGLFRTPAVHDSGGQGASELAVADLNGDGRPDIVVVNSTGASFNGVVGVLLNGGNGSFRPAVTYDSGGSVGISVAIADLNGDGKPDIVVANYTTLGVLLGNGDGTFQPAVSYASGGAVVGFGGGLRVSLVVADINGDHVPDLLVGNQGTTVDGGDGLVGVLLGKGDGTFQKSVTYDSGASGLSSIAVADLNKDGRPDLVVVNCGTDTVLLCSTIHSTVGVFLGNGDGTFGPVTTYDKGGLGNLGSPVTIADLNHDGNLDLVVGNYCPGFIGVCSDHAPVGVLLGRGDGTFQGVVTYDSGGADVESITVADVNGDGIPDLLVAPLDVLLGNGDGTFQPPVAYSNPGTSQLFVADVNGDGKLDLITGGDLTRNVGVNLGHGDGTFDPALVFPSGGVLGSWIALADVSGDGKLDILAANGANANPYASLNGTVGVLLHANLATATALASSLSPSFFGQPTTFTATVSSAKGPIPDGELVTFSEGKTKLASVALAGGVAAYTTSTLSATKHPMRATYAGDNWFATSLRTLTQAVAKDPTTTTLTSNHNPSKVGQAVTLTARVTNQYGPNPSAGKVKFFAGTIAIGTATLSGGVAKLARSTLKTGTHSITAEYLGNAASAVSTSAALNQVVQ